MTGFVLAFGTCWACKNAFGFNPHRVPSIRINGTKEPVCRPCVEAANRQREAAGLPPHFIPGDAYEALPENEL